MLGMMDCAGLFYVPFWISAAATYIGESRPAFGLLFFFSRDRPRARPRMWIILIYFFFKPALLGFLHSAHFNIFHIIDEFA
jgi:hypothetical protein